ncbi:MAG TPA: GguC family protein [Roseiflexaceae bacterium]|nr:GguC family protein [Roseiflexaceae bacterium]
MLRLVQFYESDGQRRVGIAGDDPQVLQLVDGYTSVYDMALAAIRSTTPLEQFARAHATDRIADYERLIVERRVLPPLDHPDPARCIVSLTGLTHLGSAQSRDQMHAAVAAGTASDSIRMFQIGVAGGKPAPGRIGAQPEWAYKGDGRCIVAPEHPLFQPAYADDGGEEAEIAGLYLIGDDGTPWRVGDALGNEFADHVLERQNYLYLAHSKLRQCSFGPELLVGALPPVLNGRVLIRRGDQVIWQSAFDTGEANMSHAIANLEHHHFKYDLFRRPGDLHVHFFGANGVSFGAGVQPHDGDIFEIELPLFGRPLRNPLQVDPGPAPLVTVRVL